MRHLATGGRNDPRPLLIGWQRRDRKTGPALEPEPPNGSGGRLCSILGVSPMAYRVLFQRANLLGPVGGGAVGERLMAQAVAASARSHHRILLGEKVAAAHHVPYRPFTVQPGLGCLCLVLPHPSGRCRTWNKQPTRARARQAVSEFIRGCRTCPTCVASAAIVSSPATRAASGRTARSGAARPTGQLRIVDELALISTRMVRQMTASLRKEAR